MNVTFFASPVKPKFGSDFPQIRRARLGCAICLKFDKNGIVRECSGSKRTFFGTLVPKTGVFLSSCGFGKDQPRPPVVVNQTKNYEKFVLRV